MRQTTGASPLHLVASAPEPRNPKLAREAAARLEECRAMLLESGLTETVQLLDMALLQLRMELRGVSEADLKELCEALTEQDDDDFQESR